MTTVATTAPTIKHPAGAYDRVFYTGMAVAMALTVFAGFAPTYYLREYFGAPVTVSGSTTLSPLAHLHGVVFTAWVVLFLAQTWLVASRRVAVHRRLGVAGVVLAAAMVVVGISTAIASAASGGGPPGIDPLAFLLVPVTDMVLFAGFVTAAVLRRRDRETHKRLMLLAYVSIITAAVARLPGVLPLGPLAFFGLSLIFVAAGVFYDRLSRGRIHPVYLWGGAVLVLSVPARLAISGSAAWLAIAERLVR
jgi:hypothetical protein